ncbi:MAG: sulfite exporter TauE/SafE family protein [Betaproteobacteria bacterium]|nr:sulfite exporter TauE/SafE family protein [Betaproteobacteria bacterium]
MPSLAVLAALAVSALATSFISGILGMAGGMILMGVLLALLTVPQAMVLHGVTQLASNGWRAILWRSSIDWRVFRGNALGSLLALAAFTAVQLVVSKPVALVVLGITPFVGLALPERLVLDVRKPGHPFACGVVTTGLQLVAGVSGPILDLFFVRSAMDRRAVVATKASTQSLGHILKILYFGVSSAPRSAARWTSGWPRSWSRSPSPARRSPATCWSASPTRRSGNGRAGR